MKVTSFSELWTQCKKLPARYWIFFILLALILPTPAVLGVMAFFFGAKMLKKKPEPPSDPPSLQ